MTASPSLLSGLHATTMDKLSEHAGLMPWIQNY